MKKIRLVLFLVTIVFSSLESFDEFEGEVSMEDDPIVELGFLKFALHQQIDRDCQEKHNNLDIRLNEITESGIDIQEQISLLHKLNLT